MDKCIRNNVKDGKERIVLNSNQKNVFERFSHFIKDDERRIFILNGYAGTGKTTLIRFFIDELESQKKSFTLMASTGRAAKILSNITKVNASTVHHVIYTFKDFNQDLEEVLQKKESGGMDSYGQLFLAFELSSIDTEHASDVYIIDEASMISDEKDGNATQAQFGSGKLLTDLLNFDPNGKFVFVGDVCQLPPVEQDLSPALSAAYFRSHFHLEAVESILTDIVRQQEDNTIIQASHRIRLLHDDPPKVKWGMLPLGNYEHIRLHSDISSMIKLYIDLIRGRNYERASFIASSNKKCGIINQLIRNELGFTPTLQVGDLLLVTQNNIISGLMNGDMVVVEQIDHTRSLRAGLSFVMVEVRELVSRKRYAQLLIEDILYGNTINLNQEQQQALFLDFFIRMKRIGIRQKDARFKSCLNTDSYLNALRCVFGYAVTCHKAQGGEWNDVCVDIPRNLTLNATAEKYQWIYTAITRAREHLHIVRDFFISN